MPAPDPLLLLVHTLAPPRPGGVGIVLHRLLRNLPACRIEVLTDSAQKQAVESGGPLVLPAGYRYFWKLGGRWTGLPAVRSVADLINVPAAVLAGCRAARVARREQAAWVMSVLDGAFSPLAGAIGARMAARPHVIMVFDPWPENAYSAVTRMLGRMLEGAIFRRAAAVVVYCEQAAEHYERKHRVTAKVIHTPVDAVADESAAERDPPPGPRDVVIGGAVYWAQDDAVRRLLRVGQQFPDVAITMIGGRRSLRRRRRACRVEPSRPGPDFARRLRAADVLFLGVGVKSPHPEVIRMATPARLADYMAAGRPMLVHAPRGSYAAEYVRGENLGEVVDEPDDAALAAGLRRLLDDPAGAAARAERARRLAAERHLAPVVAEAFQAVLTGARH